jgi:hypothetical protein
MEEFKKLKPLKNVDSIAISAFLKGLVFALPPFCILGFVYGKLLGGKIWMFIGVIIGVFVSVIASLLTMFVSSKFGGFASFIYKGSTVNRSIKEQLEGDLSQVRFHKMNKDFDKALLKVDAVIAEVPDYVDALYLKASILWEGFNDPIEAKRHLDKILKTTSKTDNYHVWASNMYSNIVNEERKRLIDNLSDKTEANGLIGKM